MKIGYAQFGPVLGRPDLTVKKLESMFFQMEKNDLLVLPELCNSGYNFQSRQEAFDFSEEVGESSFIQYLLEKCASEKMHIVTGFNERAGSKIFNAAILLGPDGIIGKYRKLHLFSREKEFFEPGDCGLPVFDIGSCRLGALICFDWTFPEVWRALALKGADIICHPSNLVIPESAQKAVPVHALINGVYVVTANRVGSEAELSFTGRSIISDPRGTLLAAASADGEEISVVEVDIGLARDKSIAGRNDRFADRRPAEYRDLIDPIE